MPAPAHHPPSRTRRSIATLSATRILIFFPVRYVLVLYSLCQDGFFYYYGHCGSGAPH